MAQELRIMLSGDILVVEHIILLHSIFVLIKIETTIVIIWDNKLNDNSILKGMGFWV